MSFLHARKPVDVQDELIDEQAQEEIIQQFESEAAASRSRSRWLACSLCALVGMLGVVCLFKGLDPHTELEFHSLLRDGLGTFGLIAIQLSTLVTCGLIGNHAFVNSAKSSMRALLSVVANVILWMFVSIAFTSKMPGQLLMPPLLVAVLFAAVQFFESDSQSIDKKIEQLRASKYRYKSL